MERAEPVHLDRTIAVTTTEEALRQCASLLRDHSARTLHCVGSSRTLIFRKPARAEERPQRHAWGQ